MRRGGSGRLPTATAVFADAAGEISATVRAPRLGDARAWSAARLAAGDRLRPAFDRGGDWAAEQSELAFVERCLRLRRAARSGLAVPGIVTVSGLFGTDDAVVLGEVGVDSVDVRTGTGELSAWSRELPQRGPIFTWAFAVVARHALTMTPPLRRLVAPLPVTDGGDPPSFLALGMRPEITLRNYRLYSRRWADHRIWVVHNTFESRQAAELGASVPRRASR